MRNLFHGFPNPFTHQRQDRPPALFVEYPDRLVWGESDSPDSWTPHFVMTDIAFTVQDGRARCT